jgi:hypothetical protein
MATADRLRLYSDDYPGVSTKLLRDINRMFEARDAVLTDLTQRVETLEASQVAQQAQIDSILARLLAAGIP